MKSFEPRYVDQINEAFQRGSATSVEMVLKVVDVNARDLQNGRAALSVAAEYGDVWIISLLTSHGANVNARQYSLSKDASSNEE